MTQSDDFAKSIAFALWPFLRHFQNAFIAREYKLFFGDFFCIEQLQCVVETFLGCFYTFLIFDGKWRFCKVYGHCLVAIFKMFSFSKLAVFLEPFFCIEQLMCVRNVFSMFLCIFNFWPKVTIFPLLGGHFWQFSKCSHFSNISCFLEPFFA